MSKKVCRLNGKTALIIGRAIKYFANLIVKLAERGKKYEGVEVKNYFLGN